MLSFSQKNVDHHRPRARASSGRPGPALATLCAAFGALYGAPAMAEISDTIHPFIATTVSRDSNLFRLADGEVRDGPRADTIRQVQGGFLVERPIGRQILTGQAKLSRVSFAHYDHLNYDAKDLLADLEWHVGNHVQGHVGASYAQSLTPFSDFETTERNLRVRRREYVDATWRFHPSWQVRGGYAQDDVEYELSSQRFNERTERSAELGLDYLASSGSKIGLQLRQFKGDYPNKRPAGLGVVDEGYEQSEVKANINWRISGITQVQFLGGWARRTHPQFTQRDSSGLNGRAVLYWAPLGKVRFTASAWREFGAVESSLVNSTLNKGLSLGSQWAISAKVSADAQLRTEKRDFSAIASQPLLGDTSDSTRRASLGLNYAPQPAVQLGVSLSHDVRTGSAPIGTGSYSANGVSFNASVKF